MTQSQDPDQHQELGQWRTMNTKYPRIQTRAKCAYDVKVDGQWHSWWGFQIRSSYQATTDYIFQIEYGNSATNQNVFAAPGLVTAKSDDIYQNETELLGTCHQHPLPNALRIRVLCAAPTGSDAPCFKDGDGNTIGQAIETGSVTSPQNTPAETFSPAPIKPGQVAAYWLCQNRVGDFQYYVVTDVFQGTYSLTDGVANSATLADFTQQFERWVRRRYPKAQTAGAISAQCTFMGTTQTQADQLKQQNLDQMRDFFKKDISVVVWSPK